MIQNRLLHTFLTNEKINNLYLSYLKQPSQDKKDMLENLFQIHVRKVQLLTYFSKTLHFESQRFDKKNQQLHRIHPLILDKNIAEGDETILDFIGESQTSDETPSASMTPYELADIFEDKHLYQIVSKLSTRQKEILYLLYVENLTETEVSQKLNITKQSVNKTKKQSLKKIKNNYKKEQNKCQSQT